MKADAPVWYGFLRVGGEWVHVADGHDIAKAHGELLMEGTRRGVRRSRDRALTTGSLPPEPAGRTDE